LQYRFSEKEFLRSFFSFQIPALDRRDLRPGTLSFKLIEKFPFLKDFRGVCIRSISIIKAMNKMQGTFAILQFLQDFILC